HRAAQAEERLKFGGYYRGDLDLVFCKPGGEMLLPSTVTQYVGQLKRAAGLPANVAPLHGLRHMHATNLLRAKVDLKTASVRLGHSSIKVTADIYLEAVSELDHEAAEAGAAAIALSKGTA